MDDGVFHADAELARSHWWHVGRRRLFSEEITRLALPLDAPVLDIGTSSGTNLVMLRSLGFESVSGLDPSPLAIQYCRAAGFDDVAAGSVCAMPYPDGSFQLVLATDIIEHVETDDQAVAQIARVLAPGGYALLTVPAFPVLWGHQDEVAHHKRRYRKRELLDKVRAGGLTPVRDYYFNYLLFIPILLARRLMRAAGFHVESESRINTPWLNRILVGVFRIDTSTAPVLRPPFGVSALVVAHKPAVNQDLVPGHVQSEGAAQC